MALKHPEIDPSLRAAEPPQDSLADGFSPPAEAQADAAQDHEGRPTDPALPPKSPF